MTTKKLKNRERKSTNQETQRRREVSLIEIDMFKLSTRAHDGKGNLVWSK